jgi:hypothetical protein
LLQLLLRVDRAVDLRHEGSLARVGLKASVSLGSALFILRIG